MIKTILAGAAAFALVGCGVSGEVAGDADAADEPMVASTPSADESATSATSEASAENEDATTVNDDEWSMDDAVDLVLSGATTTVTEAGVYRVTGSYAGGVVVAAPDDALVVLVLDGAEIDNSAGPAIEVQTADDVAVFLVDGTENTLSDASSYADDADANAALFSEEDLTISGTGSLTVAGNGNDGITSEDDLMILSGAITVTATDDGLRGKDSLTIEGGTISITAGGDGLKSDNEEEATRGYIEIKGGDVEISAGSDGADAQTDLIVTGGEITVVRSEEGLEAAHISLAGGTISITASDDGVNATTGSSGGGMGMGMADDGSTLEISGATVTIDSEGDGFDSNGSATMTGGVLTIYGTTRGGNGAIDVNGTFLISGGTLIAFDSGSMSEVPETDSSQGWVFATGSGRAGDTVTIANSDGQQIAELTSVKAFATVVYSSPDIASGETYAVTVGGSPVEVTANEGGMGGMGRGPGGGPGWRR